MENSTYRTLDSASGSAWSDYSRDISSANLLQDPFLVSVHIITDPGESMKLQSSADQLLMLLHPQLTLLKVSERAQRTKLQCIMNINSSLHPYLCIVLFLKEDLGGHEGQEFQLRCPPWLYHHTERINGSLSDIQDFFTLAHGTPLWAVRHISYGKRTVRFTVYCRYETYSQQVRLYKLLLRRPMAHMNKVFCFCVVYSNQNTEIQLALRRLPPGRNLGPIDCAIMEIRVRDLEGLLPYLPHTCKPISEHRWQTEDCDGNKILLQVQSSSTHCKHIIPVPLSDPSDSRITFEHPTPENPASGWNDHGRNRSSSHAQCSMTMLYEQKATDVVQHGQKNVYTRTVGPCRHSQFNITTKTFHSTNCPSSFSAIPRFRINVDMLVGAEETDVDTGQAVSSSSLDLSVVSAYSRSKPFRRLSASRQELDSSITLPQKQTFPTPRSANRSNLALRHFERIHTLSDQARPKSNKSHDQSKENKISTEEFYI